MDNPCISANESAHRRPPDPGIRPAWPGAECLVDIGFQGFNQELGIQLSLSLAKFPVIVWAVFRNTLSAAMVDRNDDQLSVTLCRQRGKPAIDSPIAKRSILIEEVLRVLEVEHRIFLFGTVIVIWKQGPNPPFFAELRDLKGVADQLNMWHILIHRLSHSLLFTHKHAKIEKGRRERSTEAKAEEEKIRSRIFREHVGMCCENSLRFATMHILAHSLRFREGNKRINSTEKTMKPASVTRVGAHPVTGVCALLALILLFNCNEIFSQQVDTTRNVNLPDVTVTAFKEEPFNKTSLNITSVHIDSLGKTGNYNLTDLVAKLPGVTMLSTGVSIAKPVIRGLYGNRILILLNGLKFDNQQWQEEHGLGLSDLGLSKVEVIKGPMSALYGSEAIGGVINLVDEVKPAIGTQETDYSVKLNSNTFGGLAQCGHNVNLGDHWWRIRTGVENNADYSDGNGDRVLNSRFDGYYLKAAYGFQHRRWISNTTYSGSFNRFGFIFNDIYNFVTPDARQSRDLSVNPAHLVLLNILSSDNTFSLKNNSTLTVNVGVQSNERMENEGGGAISLNMHLLTFQYLMKWETAISAKSTMILSNLTSIEDNTNYGARKIIPDALMEESNLAAYLETQLSKTVNLENGIAGGEKYIKTYFTPSVNSPDKEIRPFSKFSPYYNLFSGVSWTPRERLNLKLNVATGVRIPNLAELSSDGLHEGVFTYEIGDPDLKNEQIASVNLLIDWQPESLECSISPFYNHFFHYVYLAPTTEQWFGFPVFRYRQQDANQYGTEATVALRTAGLRAGSSYSGMISRTTDGNDTPYTPAQKISPFVHYRWISQNGPVYAVFTSADYCLAQNNIYPGEIATPAYFLWNAGFSGTFTGQHSTCEFSLTGNNLLGEGYYDHLSRFKYFGLLNIGRNIVVSAKITFHSAARGK